MRKKSSSGVEKKRIDLLMVEKGLAPTRERAQALLMSGSVRIGDQVMTKPGTSVPADSELTVAAGLPYVSRGGLKLEHALDEFRVDPAGKVAADIGASTGGFTDVLLQRGAAKVYAIDVGYGQLDWKIRSDQRVVVMDRTNVRHIDALPETVEIATIDVSFISLSIVLPAAKRFLRECAEVVTLIKPQFEAGKGKLGKGGVVRDPLVHREVLERVIRQAQELGFTVRGLTRSPITGPAGNVEFLVHLVNACPAAVADFSHRIDELLPEA
jgi:23S rRNA (cytidine1920-2'-O)/16S rRNA (cytidine1409-2'-O)-methyltransferase